LMSFVDVQELGKKRKINGSGEFLRAIQQTAGDDLALIVFTPGTTGCPKPAMFSHKNMISFLRSIPEMFPKFRTHEQRAVCYQGLAHPLERFISVYFPMIYDVRPYIGETIESLQETLCEVQPTLFHGVPKIWKKLAARIMVGIEGSSWPKELSYRLAMKIGWKYHRLKQDPKKAALMARLLRWIAEQISFRHIRHQFGFSKVKEAISVGGPLPPRIQDLWQVWGVDLLNCYGLTELAGVISFQLQGFPNSGDLGKPLSIYKTKLAHDGELLISGSGIFCGYWGDEEKTREVMKDGWFYTNDIFEGGEEESLKFIDRKQNVIITSEERKITPTHIENLIKSSPYISDVGIFTDRQNILSALIEIDFDTVAEWARRNNVLHAGFTGLVDRSEVYELIREEVREANQYLPEEEQVKKIRILPKQLNPGAGDITPTGKIKKGLFYERFRNLIEEPYRSEKEETSGNRSERE
jgi:long-chain acyl-CoA synthetase